MFNVKQINGKNVYFSDKLFGLEHFFTTRDLIVKENIEEIFNLSGRDDLCYYITSDALIYAYEKAGII